MTEQELNNKIKGAFSRATPDVLDAVRSQCSAQKGTVIPMKQPNRKRYTVRRLGVLAAALALVITLGAGTGMWQANRAVASTVSLDVNPSIEIKVNKNEKVLSVTPLNDDGKTVIGDMDFARSDLDVTINALIGSMLRNGYLNELANSILISVDDSNPQRGKALESRLAGEVNALLQTGAFSGSVLSQTLSTNSDLDTLAEQHGITAGKARLIQQIVTQNTNYNFEELAPLSINELNLISESGSLHLDEVNATGTASDKAYIGIDAAKAAALAYFSGQLPADSQPRWEWEMDFEHGRMVYELEANYTNGTEFDCYVDALTGQVISGHHEQERGGHHEGSHHSGSASTPSPSPSPSPSVTLITVEEAKAAALAHAKVSAADAYGWECELDRDNGRTVYDLDFHANGYEYNYEINAVSGSVVKYERERDDDGPIGTTPAPTPSAKPTPSPSPSATPAPSPAPSSSPSVIGADAAKAAALAHAKVSAADAYKWECELDRDDGRTVYEIEFKAGRYEYSYEVDAYSGAILDFEKEIDD